jgi:hypothetical protein
MRKALGEMERSPGREPTPLLASLMLSTTFKAVAPAVQALEIPAPADRQILSAVALGVLWAARLGLERGLRGAADLSPDLVFRIEAAHSPLVFWGRIPVSGIAANTYGPELATGVPEHERIAGLLESGLDPDTVLKELEAALEADGEADRRAAAAVTAWGIRELALAAALAAERDGVGTEVAGRVTSLVVRPPALLQLLSDEKGRKALSKNLSDWAAQSEPMLGAAVVALRQALMHYSYKAPAEALGLSAKQVRGAYARAALAYLCDLAMEKALAGTRRALEARTGAEAEGGLEAEYQAGRLYRLGTGDQPILKPSANPLVGHLFVDVKDFTRRTALLGQAAMADFLRREFYLPVLASARARYGGADHSGISVNNLLGDAVSISGQVEDLVALAVELRRHLAAYVRSLQSAVSPEQVAQAERAIAEKYARLLDSAPPSAQSQVEAEAAAALARVRGQGLEAGVFISYGPAPLVITLEDDVFGKNRVAIADRINESARGTARSRAARSRADAQLRAEANRREKPDLRHAWCVFCDAPFQVTLPGPVEIAVREALRRGEMGGAKAIATRAVEELLDEAAQRGAPPGDIYNAGVALSEEALLAYQEAAGDRRILRKLELAPEQLHPEIQERYFVPREPLTLWVSFYPNGEIDLVFRHAGRVMFRGFERSGGVPVWELVDEFGIGALFKKHHAAEWLQAGAPR